MSEHEPALPYRDASLPVEDRVEDLLGRMTVAEKAGMLFQTMITPGPIDEANPHMGLASGEHMIGEQLMSHFNVLGTAPDTTALAEWTNALQERASRTRLGIPVTLSTDPRNHFTDNVGTAARAGAFSQWPETLGLAAIGSVDLVEAFADTARQEYLAVGIRLALHPQVDLATEPRWSRIGGTFGEDAELSAELVAGYIRGFQGAELGPQSVSTMTKHFPGGGPQLDGEDPHFAYGREQVYPGDNFDYHLIPFRAAIAAGAAQIMPYYGMPVGTGHEEVAFAFNHGIITGLLREELGFDGIVCTDWGLVTDTSIMGQDMPARAWGLEHLDELSRVERILQAGCDQFGGEARPELVVELVEQGRITEDRVDASVRRLLREKFVLGLFEQPYVDAGAASGIVGRADFVAAGEAAQRRAFTVLTNVEETLPVRSPRPRLYLEGVDPELAGAYGEVVADPASADVALVRMQTPYEPRPGGFEAMFHAGSLDIPADEVERLRALALTVPTVLDMHLDRPAILTGVADAVAALVASFGGSDAAFLDVVFGRALPEGRLPFDLPRSMAAVEASRSDVPYDTEDPLFRFGHGLTYPGR
ncbi:glycoside hydrolase family 3 C-terminal domain-containing protein [Plantibacter sp. CFBP 8798]|uniref:glycoside hydrolase family 3 protein n=1 Tax=Plantibacter sp. CFBP 8798 TaxID=2775268 RepID=UPI0017816EC6|nr:glycoside hydrolase family 3 N-terminal domain-containing protein [Plantibacter sp. CFBP 8798]MBD8467137.1 glycoside hydrolase family 3 C-terminal domain-containing protein [Plantibacter sp. CFBP 8798]